MQEIAISYRKPDYIRGCP